MASIERPPGAVFTSERDAITAIKELTAQPVRAGDIMVVIGCGPLGTGMEETYQLTSALRHLPEGKHIALLTDARFSGVSSGACIGHIGPEALAGGPIGRLRDGDILRIRVDRLNLEGEIDLIGDGQRMFTASEAAGILGERGPHPNLAADPTLPEDTRLWAALQNVSGGTWGGCVYDVDQIIKRLEDSKS
jgi:dihydroxyacid dehydratase/phosphogluconate dehydratase